jgi:hypothetical protein
MILSYHAIFYTVKKKIDVHFFFPMIYFLYLEIVEYLSICKFSTLLTDQKSNDF